MVDGSEKLQQHPIAKLFPLPDQEALDKIRRSVFKAQGITPDNPVKLYEGMVIENWEAYTLCSELEYPFATADFTGSREELLEYLLKITPYQLDKQHKALIGAYFKKIYRDRAKANQSAGGAKQTFIPEYHSRNAADDKMKISPRMISNAESIIDFGVDGLLDLVLSGLISISRAADIARLKEAEQKDFFNSLNRKLRIPESFIHRKRQQQDDALTEKYEEQVRYIKAVYKEKRETLNLDIRRRINLADTPEEAEELKAERIQARKLLKDNQAVNLEKAQLEYEKKRRELSRKYEQQLFRQRKKYLAELVMDALSYEPQYLVYMRWDYELGEIKLTAAWDITADYDKETDIATLESGRRIHCKTELIKVVQTADIAKGLCKQINDKHLMNYYRIFQPNSKQQRIFNNVGAKFLRKVKN